MSDRSEQRPPLVSIGVEIPKGLVSPQLVLEPLKGTHNEADYAAWTSSIDHIRSTPGFGPDQSWPPDQMSLAENLSDLEQHDQDFRQRTGFTFTVLPPDDTNQVIGCVYIYPDPTGRCEVEVRSWVTASQANLDPILHETVLAWLQREWPFTSIRYADRSAGAPGNPA